VDTLTFDRVRTGYSGMFADFAGMTAKFCVVRIEDLKWEPLQGETARLCVLQKADFGDAHIRLFEFNNRGYKETLKPSPKYHGVETVHWSPAGRHICLAHVNGDRTFFDTESMKDRKQSHEGASEVLWDPSGRFLLQYLQSRIN